MEKEACSNGEQQEVEERRRQGKSINQSHNTENIQSHDNYMVITNTQENTKPPGRTHGLRPAHETARTLRHHYERKSCERVKDAYSIPHPVPPKITPRARMVPATAPISLLVATLTVQREKEHYYHPVKNKQQASASESWMTRFLCDVSNPLKHLPVSPVSNPSGVQLNCVFTSAYESN